MKKRTKLVRPSSFLSGDSSDDDGAAEGSDFVACTEPEIPSHSSITTRIMDHFRSAVELQERGCELASEGDLWGALSIWGKALQHLHLDSTSINNRSSNNSSSNNSNPSPTSAELNYRCAMLHELKAQVLMELDLLVKACHEAHCSVSYVPCWPIGHQTLGRCQREMGEIFLSRETYRVCRALVHGKNPRRIVTEPDEEAMVVADVDIVTAICGCFVCGSKDCTSPSMEFFPIQSADACNCGLDSDNFYQSTSGSSSGISSESLTDTLCDEQCREICTECFEVETLASDMENHRQAYLAPLQNSSNGDRTGDGDEGGDEGGKGSDSKIRPATAVRGTAAASVAAVESLHAMLDRLTSNSSGSSGSSSGSSSSNSNNSNAFDKFHVAMGTSSKTALSLAKAGTVPVSATPSASATALARERGNGGRAGGELVGILGTEVDLEADTRVANMDSDAMSRDAQEEVQRCLYNLSMRASTFTSR